jgi:hypothetical protein
MSLKFDCILNADTVIYAYNLAKLCDTEHEPYRLHQDAHVTFFVLQNAHEFIIYTSQMLMWIK